MDVEEHTDDLSVQQIEAVHEFQEKTGVANLARVRDKLHRHDWQIEKAFYDQLILKAGYPSRFSKEPDVPDLSVELNSDKLQVFNAETSGTNSYLSFVINYLLKTFYDKVVSLVFSWRSIWPKRPLSITDPVADVESFISYFELKYGDSHPVFYKGSYNQALNDAKRESLFLVVYLHKRDQSDCSNFCSLLTHEKIISFMDEGNTVFWACDLDSNEGNRVATTLQAHNVHPYVSVVVLIDGIMTQVAQMRGLVSIQEFLNILQTIIVVNQPNTVLGRVEGVEKRYSTMLRECYNLKPSKPDEEEQKDDEYFQKQILEIQKMITKNEERELKEKHELEKYIQNQKLTWKKILEEKPNNEYTDLLNDILDGPSVDELD